MLAFRTLTAPYTDRLRGLHFYPTPPSGPALCHPSTGSTASYRVLDLLDRQRHCRLVTIATSEPKVTA